MVVRRILTAVLGVLAVIAGVYCLAWPGLTYVSMAWIVGATMLVNGVANLISWPERKRIGLANGWSLAGAVVSVLFGVVLLVSNSMRFLMDVYLVYMAAAWLVVYGVLRIAMAFKMRSLRKNALADPAVADMLPRPRWGWVLCMGVLMVVGGVIGFLNPLTLALAMGVLIGSSIVMLGIDLIATAFVA